MKRHVDFCLGILAGLVITALAVLLSVFLWNWINPISYLAPGTTTANIPTDLAAVINRVEQLEIEQAYQLKVFEWKLDQKLLILGWTALFISFVAAFVGIKTYQDLDKVIQDKINTALEKELYQLDPTNLRIWVISPDEEQRLFIRQKNDYEMVKVDEEMEIIIERLKLSSFSNLESREILDKKSYHGVTIVPIFNEEMENQYVGFLERNHSSLDKEHAAFVLYTQTYQVSKKTLDAYRNQATANMPATAVSMVLTVGRGLKGTKKKIEKEDV